MKLVVIFQFYKSEDINLEDYRTFEPLYFVQELDNNECNHGKELKGTYPPSPPKAIAIIFDKHLIKENQRETVSIWKGWNWKINNKL